MLLTAAIISKGMESESSPQHLHPTAESPNARRILEIDEELELLRHRRPTVFGVVARGLIAGSLLAVALKRLGPDPSENFGSFVMLAVVAVWGASVALRGFEHVQRGRHLQRELDTLIAAPRRSDPRVVSSPEVASTDE